jgi:6-phosphogluconolactonase
MGMSKTTFVYVGSGSFGAETGKVTVYRLDRQAPGLEFVSDTEAGGLASFLAVDSERRRLYAADEVKGGVLSFTIDPTTGALTSLGATPHSNHPVSLSISPDGKYLLGANYNEGNVDVYPIGDDGKASASSQTVATGSHAHSVRFDQEGKVLVANEGSDTISHLTFNGGMLSAATPPTSASFSPRHLAFHPNGTVFVVSERGDFITAYSRAENGSLNQIWQKPRLDSGQPTANTGADIHLTPDGRTLYASNRGQSNTIVMYDIRGAEPVLLGHVSTRGTTPRNFAVDPEGQFLLVGNHGDQKTLALFRIESDGKLTEVKVEPMQVSPFFVTFVQF